MSQHDNSQQDKVFVRNFSAVLGVLIMAAIGAYVLASGVTGGSRNAEADAIKPVSAVQVATTEAKPVVVAEAKVATPAPAPAKEEVKPAETAATPAAETAKPAEAVPAAEGTAKPAEAAPAAGGAMTTEQVTTLMTQKGYTCMACHQVEAKLVGPGFKEIGLKYKGDAKAAEALAQKVKAGGAGAWGEMPMPPNPTVTDEDMKAIVGWVLALQ